jgi:hypothetical protein
MKKIAKVFSNKQKKSAKFYPYPIYNQGDIKTSFMVMNENCCPFSKAIARLKGTQKYIT